MMEEGRKEENLRTAEASIKMQISPTSSFPLSVCSVRRSTPALCKGEASCLQALLVGFLEGSVWA